MTDQTTTKTRREIIRRTFTSLDALCAAEWNKRTIRDQIASDLAVGEWLGAVS